MSIEDDLRSLGDDPDFQDLMAQVAFMFGAEEGTQPMTLGFGPGLGGRLQIRMDLSTPSYDVALIATPKP